MSEISWRDALTAAVSCLPAGDPDALLFFEQREDFRVTLEDGALREQVVTRLEGCSARRNSLELHQSDPGPDDLRRLATAAAEKRALPARADPQHLRRPQSLQGVDSAESKRAARVLQGVADRIERLRSGVAEEIATTLQWISFRQRIQSVRPGRELRGDLREGARLRVRVRVRRGSTHSEATADLVIRAPHSESAIARVADDVVGRARRRFHSRPAPRGEQAAVFAPGVGGILFHELVGHALEADTVQSGGSALVRAIPGLIPPTIVVMDDPRRGRASWKWDDEGEEARAVPLLQSGRVAGALHDLRSSRRAGKPTTGHGRRSAYLEPVRPRMGCTFLAPGSDDPKEIVEATARGVYVRRMESAGIDPASARAFFRVTDADRIANGKLDEPLDPFLVCVDSVRALSTLDRVGDDLAFDTCIGTCVRDGQPLATSVGTPTCRVGLISVFL